MAIEARKLKAFAKREEADGKTKGRTRVDDDDGPEDLDEADPEVDENGETDEEIAARVGAQVLSGKVDDGLLELVDELDPESQEEPPWADPDLWDRAMAAVKPSWDVYENPLLVVAHVYVALGGELDGMTTPDDTADEPPDDAETDDYETGEP